MPVMTTLGSLSYGKLVTGNQYYALAYEGNGAIAFDNNNTDFYILENVNSKIVVLQTSTIKPINIFNSITANTVDFQVFKTSNRTTATTDRITVTSMFTASEVANMYIEMGVKFRGTTFGGIANNISYYYSSAPQTNTNTFTISTTPGGNNVNLTANGTGNMSTFFINENQNNSNIDATDIKYNSFDNKIYVSGSMQNRAPASLVRLNANYGVVLSFSNSLSLLNQQKFVSNTSWRYLGSEFRGDSFTKIECTGANSCLVYGIDDQPLTSGSSNTNTYINYCLSNISNVSTINYSKVTGNAGRTPGYPTSPRNAIIDVLSNTEILAGGSNGEFTIAYGNGYSSFISKLNIANGQQVLQINIPGNDSVYPSNIDHGNLLAVTHDSSNNIIISLDDYKGSNVSVATGGHLAKLDSNGNVLYRQIYANVKFDLLAPGNNVIYFTNGTNVGEFDSNGNVTWVKNFYSVTGGGATATLGNIVDIKYYNNDIYLIQNVSNSGIKIGTIFYKIPNNGNIANANIPMTVNNVNLNLNIATVNSNTYNYNSTNLVININNTSTTLNNSNLQGFTSNYSNNTANTIVSQIVIV